jgi:hypothetical protein
MTKGVQYLKTYNLEDATECFEKAMETAQRVEVQDSEQYARKFGIQLSLIKCHLKFTNYPRVYYEDLPNLERLMEEEPD